MKKLLFTLVLLLLVLGIGLGLSVISLVRILNDTIKERNTIECMYMECAVKDSRNLLRE